MAVKKMAVKPVKRKTSKMVNTLFDNVNDQDGESVLSNLFSLANLLKIQETDPSKILGLAVEKLTAVPYCPFPISFSTIDIMPYFQLEGEWYVVLGRKYNQTKPQVFGGFRDPRETTEAAALRELHEESTIVGREEDTLYVGSKFIDDWRYKDSCHKITTSMFITHIEYSQVEAALALQGQRMFDDIEEISVHKLEEVKMNADELIREIHIDLAKHLTTQISMQVL